MSFIYATRLLYSQIAVKKYQFFYGVFLSLHSTYLMRQGYNLTTKNAHRTINSRIKSKLYSGKMSVASVPRRVVCIDRRESQQQYKWDTFLRKNKSRVPILSYTRAISLEAHNNIRVYY